MNFKGHAIGGVITASVITGALTLATDLNPETILTATAITLVMSFFPDFDIFSIPQKWFTRAIFVTLIFTLLTGQQTLFNIISLSMFAFFLSKHRGWTHGILTPWVICLAVFGSNYYLPEVGLSKIELLIFSISCISGHYTHLFLDSKFVKNIRE